MWRPLCVVIVLALSFPALAAEDAAALRIGFVADAQETGERPGLRAAVASLERSGAGWLLYGGDTSYGYGEAPPDWVDALGPYANRTLFVYGNHDGGSSYARFQPRAGNATWWAWERDGIVVIGLDWSKPLLAGSPQYEWLDRALARHRDDVVIVAIHVAWWVPNAHHASDLAVTGNAAQLDALMVKGKVDLVLGAHEHYYARMERDGIPYVVGGAVEARTRDVPSEVANASLRSTSNRTWMTIDLLPCGGVAATTHDAASGQEEDAFATCAAPSPAASPAAGSPAPPPAATMPLSSRGAPIVLAALMGAWLGWRARRR